MRHSKEMLAVAGKLDAKVAAELATQIEGQSGNAEGLQMIVAVLRGEKDKSPTFKDDPNHNDDGTFRDAKQRQREDEAAKA